MGLINHIWRAGFLNRLIRREGDIGRGRHSMIIANKGAASLIVGMSVILFTSVVSAQMDMTAKRAVAVLTCRSQTNWEYPGIDSDSGKSRRWAYAICMIQKEELP
jgi:hypothetical protein